MAKKKAVKKQSESKEVAIIGDEMLIAGNLNQTLANLGELDTSVLGDVELDIADDIALFKNDIVIPKIWLIQAMSELRKAKKADEGDYVDSRSEDILLASDEEDALPIIVIKTFKRWQTFKMVKDGKDVKKVFLKSEVMTMENADLKYQETLEGEDLVRRQVISCYVLLGSDAQAGIFKPYIVDFASTSKGAGRDLVSDIKVLNTDKKNPKTGKLIRRGLPSWVAYFKLGKFEESKEHDYYVKTIKFGGMLPQEMWNFLKECKDEVSALMINDAVEIDDRDVHDAAKSEKSNANVNNKAGTSSAKI